ncbi:FAD-dependent thymidylate synthase [Zongyangia hominis]|uniref:Flavin-dependent thymidylate synthase n=1 Tax=Zongyangia hominis TaxID=2763677 RepID=A0A926EBA5_9FIRM|nr:FAD-dependent thymidylate synthase [Zongyangia hominis]MBC8569890.1 FAD-dependent thymidylate synthase [Zongyangia hominis]
MAYVTLLAHTPMPEKIVASAAKLCYAQSDIETVMDNLDEKKTAAFVDMLSELGHESPIEHASFTFGIQNVSRALLAQITRHRLASFSVQSQRYVKENHFEFVTPPEIAADPEAAAVFQGSMENALRDYLRLSDILQRRHEKALLEEGVDEKTARSKAEKMAIEDARFVLPNACDTKMIVTMNARSLQNFFRHRCCSRAQWEIRDVANQMLVLCKEAAPALFKKAGPSCVAGQCPEGKMSCGKTREMRERYLGKEKEQRGENLG